LKLERADIVRDIKLRDAKEQEELKKSPPEQHPEILKRQESFGLSGVRETIDIGKLDLKEETRKSRTSVRIEKKNTISLKRFTNTSQHINLLSSSP